MSKHLILCLIAFLAMVISSPTALADSPVRIDDLDMEIRATEDWYILTHDVTEDHPLLRKIKWTSSDVTKLLDDVDGYAYMISKDSNMTIVLSAEAMDTPDLYTLHGRSKEDLTALLEAILSGEPNLFGAMPLDASGHSRLDAGEIYDHPEIPFFYMRGRSSMNENAPEIVYALTVNNGQWIGFGFQSFNERDITEGDHRIIQSFLKDVHFTRITAKPPGRYDTLLMLAGMIVLAALVIVVVPRLRDREAAAGRALQAAQQAALRKAVEEQVDEANDKHSQDIIL